MRLPAHAVKVAVSETLRAAELQREGRWIDDKDAEEGRYETGHQPGGAPGDRRVGVVWHTQGSSKSLTMAFYAGRIIHESAMEMSTVAPKWFSVTFDDGPEQCCPARAIRSNSSSLTA